jgi:hypothetical protein
MVMGKEGGIVQALADILNAFQPETEAVYAEND